jgi:hypothetical protein
MGNLLLVGLIAFGLGGLHTLLVRRLSVRLLVGSGSLPSLLLSTAGLRLALVFVITLALYCGGATLALTASIGVWSARTVLLMRMVFQHMGE